MAARTSEVNHPNTRLTTGPTKLDESADNTSVNGESAAEHLATRSISGKVMIAAIRFYQRTISVALPPSCRFYPSCSEYTLQAVARYGPLKGGWMGIKRILRCQPFSPGGYDPVP